MVLRLPALVHALCAGRGQACAGEGARLDTCVCPALCAGRHVLHRVLHLCSCHVCPDECCVPGACRGVGGILGTTVFPSARRCLET